MPNPINMVVGPNQRARFTKNATQAQRITLTSGGQRHVVDLPSGPLNLSAGTWEILHETIYNGDWRKGLGRKRTNAAEFDDNPDGAGDNDYNDARVVIEDRD